MQEVNSGPRRPWSYHLNVRVHNMTVHVRFSGIQLCRPYFENYKMRF